MSDSDDSWYDEFDEEVLLLSDEEDDDVGIIYRPPSTRASTRSIGDMSRAHDTKLDAAIVEEYRQKAGLNKTKIKYLVCCQSVFVE